MSIDEFRILCREIFQIENKDGKSVRKGFPVGCNDCPDINSSDCHEYCMWPENYWRYEEVKNYWLLAKAQDGGLNVNRLESLSLDDFVKLSIIKEYL